MANGDLISPGYLAENARLHRKTTFGKAGGKRWHEVVDKMATHYHCKSILDYGCGKASLSGLLEGKYDCRNYDPAIPKYAGRPEPADLVVCTDVLEHVEPEYLDNVLADLYRCTDHVGFLVISNQKAKKTLADGRNAHLIIESGQWWIDKVRDAGFKIVGVKVHTDTQLETVLHVKRGANG